MKLLCLFLYFCSSFTFLLACDVCGGNSFSVGILPQYHKNYVGLRYRHQAFNYPAAHNGGGNERFHAIEWVTRIYPHPRLQVWATLPYIFHNKTSSSLYSQNNGWGDFQVMAAYKIFSTELDTTQFIKNQIFVGLGGKLPTGKFNEINTKGKLWDATFQNGSGSYDALVSVQHTARYKKWGANTQFFFKYNTFNSLGYKFGNQLILSSFLYYMKQISRTGWMPYLGIYVEKGNAHQTKSGDTIYGTYNQQLGGQTGVELFWGKLSCGINAQIPIFQDFADNLIVAKPRSLIQVGYLF